MALRPLSSFLLRAPLLPISELRRHDLAAKRHDANTEMVDEWMRAALMMASASLDAFPKRGSADTARVNYTKRAAFRPTPHQLWAGVAVGTLGPRTHIKTGTPTARLTVSFATLSALARALLSVPDLREEVRIRRAPSLLRAGRRIAWLSTDAAGEAVTLEAEVDDDLHHVLESTENWRTFHDVRAALRAKRTDEEDEEIDRYLLQLLEDRLLLHDLEPPLIGPRPLDWMRQRLQGRLPELDEVARLLEDERRPIHTRIEEARRRLQNLFSASDIHSGDGRLEQPLHAVLQFQSPKVMLSRRAVERAAELAPLLFALQEALSPPASERDLDGALAPLLDATTEIFGIGALPFYSVALGDYGAKLLEGERPTASIPPSLLQFLVDKLMQSAASGEIELSLRSEELAKVVPPGPMPPSFELFLVPTRASRGAPGQGWLLGLHAPAGATFGRFAHALGTPLVDVLKELDRVEMSARPWEERLDVAFAPSPALADLAAHPPIRDRHLALTAWGESPAVTPSELDLVADPAALDPVTLRAGAQPIALGPLHRLRAVTALQPFRLLCGHPLFRQHAPWALQLGGLDALEHLPRISIDGFVVSPASWAIPTHVDSAAAIKRWRSARNVPRHIQIGFEDELLPIDLEDARDLETLLRRAPERRPRAYEIWPPLDAHIDEDGRRVEVVIAVVDEPDEVERVALAHAAEKTRTAGVVLPPRRAPPPEEWRTYKLFAAADRLESLLLAHVAPVVRHARAVGEIEGWFFLRYVDGPGSREHLRLRVKAATRASHRKLADRLTDALRAPMREGDLIAIENTGYHRELARYGGEAAMTMVEEIWEADSEMSCAILAEPEESRVLFGVRGFDALAAGLGLSIAERLAGAESCLAAYRKEVEEVREVLASEYRAEQVPLQEALGREPGSFFAPYITRVAKSAGSLPLAQRGTLLPALLHLSAVRTWGLSRMDEVRVLYHWQRARFGLSRRKR
jgi:thiopeptide-type bacteriocin biosynthesis protein